MTTQERGEAMRAGGLSSLWGASVTVGVLGLLTLLRVPFALAVIAQFMVPLTPGNIATAAIEQLGHFALPGFAIGVAVAFLVVSWLAGRLGARRPVVSETAFVAWILFPWWVAWSLSHLLTGMPGTLLFAGFTALAPALGTWAGAAALRRPETKTHKGIDASIERPDIAASQSRRMLLRTGVVGGAGLAFAVRNLSTTPLRSGSTPTRTITAAAPASTPVATVGDAAFEKVDGLSPLYTPVSKFYTVDEALFDPMVDPATWTLTITGLVDNPQTFTYDQLLKMETTEQIRMLGCISNTVGGDLAGNTRWTGVLLPHLLERAGVQPGAVEIVFRSVEGFSSSHPVEHANSPDALVAFAMDGAELPVRHGFPARILMPGTYGMKNPKWLSEIELVAQPYLGYWESRGWSNTAVIQTESRIDTPRGGSITSGKPTNVAGVAWAGDRSISKVEVSTDGGTTWQEADLESPASHLAWVRWLYRWTPDQPGDALLVVRATDGDGALQVEAMTDAHPSGATGWHHIGIRVT